MAMVDDNVVREACEIVQSRLAILVVNDCWQMVHFVNVAGSRIVAPFGGREANYQLRLRSVEELWRVRSFHS